MFLTVYLTGVVIFITILILDYLDVFGKQNFDDD